MFVARLNPDGTLAWVRQAGGAGGDAGSGVQVLADGTAFVTGYFGSVYSSSSTGPDDAVFGLGESNETTPSYG